MNYKLAFHIAYLKQQGLKPTETNILNYSVDKERLVLLNETPTYWIVKVKDDGQAGEFLDVIYKDNFEMDTIELRQK